MVGPRLHERPSVALGKGSRCELSERGEVAHAMEDNGIVFDAIDNDIVAREELEHIAAALVLGQRHARVPPDAPEEVAEALPAVAQTKGLIDQSRRSNNRNPQGAGCEASEAYIAEASGTPELATCHWPRYQ